MAALLRALEWQVAAFEAGDRPDYDVVRAALDYFQRFPDAHHHPREQLLFARLRERDPKAADSVWDLGRAHAELSTRADKFAAALRAILEDEEIPRNAFAHLARGFIELQRQHIDMEESAFFPAAERALVATDWGDLTKMVALEADPLQDEKFDELRRTILRWQAQDQSVFAHH